MSTSRRAVLRSRMQAACGGSCRHLALIERQIAVRARRMTITASVNARPGHHSRRADDRRFRELVERLGFERRRGIEAVARHAGCVQSAPRSAILPWPRECEYG